METINIDGRQATIDAVPAKNWILGQVTRQVSALAAAIESNDDDKIVQAQLFANVVKTALALENTQEQIDEAIAEAF